MFKFVFSAVVCAAMCIPAVSSAQDCGCCEPAPNPCVKTRKKLKIVEVETQVCRLKRVCSTDACGCPTSKLVRESKTVTRPKLTMEEVAVDPCRRGCLKRLRDRLGKIGCAKPACGCAAPEPCGCEAAPEPAPCGCGDSIMEPVAAPAASCCGG